jgi:hypothetical protein
MLMNPVLVLEGRMFGGLWIPFVNRSRFAARHWLKQARECAAFEIMLPSDPESFRPYATTESGKSCMNNCLLSFSKGKKADARCESTSIDSSIA